MQSRGSRTEEQTGQRDRLPLYKRAAWVYAVGLGCVGGALIWADESWPHVGWLQRNGPNFGADLIGLAVTLLLIDRIVAWRREADLHPLRQSAIRRVGKGMRDLEIQMAWIFKAASEPAPEPKTIDELIDAFVIAVPDLDFDAESSMVETPWRLYLPQRLELIASNLDRAVSRHEEVLPPSFAASVDAVIDDPSLGLLRNADALATALKLVEPEDLLPRSQELVVALKSMYHEYAALRGRPYELVAWDIPRDWATARRAVADSPSAK